MAALPEGSPAPLDGNLTNLFDLVNKPFSLYVHVPYCSKRCGYCDFNTYTPSELDREDQIESWLNSAVKEIELARRVLKEELTIDTIFFGGGTPSLLDSNTVDNFIQSVKSNFKLKPGLEITIEANPDSITEEKSQRWLNSGINRVSIGMQSSTKEVLKKLDRTHNPDNVSHSVDILKKSGFDNFSLDLIYGTPGESLNDWENSLKDAIALNPPHISAYSLVIEPGTKMGAQLNRGEISQVNDDEAADKYQLADEMLNKNNYSWYEISNWAKKDKECKHNLNYWLGNNWWGIGPGAHSHVNGVRWWNHKLPKVWRELLEKQNSPALAREVLSEDQIKSEQIMLLSRLRTGLGNQELDENRIENLIANQLATLDANKIVLTLKGRLLADEVFRQLSA
ncbi:MAG: radical SAM family heme chaperone HemW [Actinomycetes bacterium]